MRAILVCGILLRSHQQRWTEPLLPRKRAPDTIHSTPADRSMGPYPVSLPCQPLKQWGKATLCGQPATRLTGPISPAYDWYIQYLLTGVNPSVINQHRRGLQSWRCRLSTYHSPTILTCCLHFPLRPPLGLRLSQPTITNWAKGRSSPKPCKWEPSLEFYHNLSSKHRMS
jgi:hypothetical protein